VASLQAYAVAEGQGGKGYATKAVSDSLDSLARAGMTRIEAKCTRPTQPHSRG